APRAGPAPRRPPRPSWSGPLSETDQAARTWLPLPGVCCGYCTPRGRGRPAPASSGVRAPTDVPAVTPAPFTPRGSVRSVTTAPVAGAGVVRSVTTARVGAPGPVAAGPLGARSARWTWGEGVAPAWRAGLPGQGRARGVRSVTTAPITGAGGVRSV